MIIQLKAVEKTQRERLHVAYVTSHQYTFPPLLNSQC